MAQLIASEDTFDDTVLPLAKFRVLRVRRLKENTRPKRYPLPREVRTMGLLPRGEVTVGLRRLEMRGVVHEAVMFRRHGPETTRQSRLVKIGPDPIQHILVRPLNQSVVLRHDRLTAEWVYLQ